MEIQRLYETGFHIVRLDRRTPYERYLDKTKNLLRRVNDGTMTTETYSWEIQILMKEYKDVLESERNKKKTQT